MPGWWVESMISQGRQIELISWIFWVLISIMLHELAHGWAAIWQGDRTPIHLHRMTFNPLVHMGVPSLIVFAIAGIAWGVMPVNPSAFRSRKWGRLYVAIAGPVMNLIIGGMCLLLLAAHLTLFPATSELYPKLATFLMTGLWLNFVLAVFNMLPIPPLDGAEVAGTFSFRLRVLYASPNAPFVGLMAMMLLFITPLGGVLFGGGIRACVWLVDTIGGLTGAPPIRSVW